MAEGARLESVFRGNSNVGSNPTLSASYLTEFTTFSFRADVHWRPLRRDRLPHYPPMRFPHRVHHSSTIRIQRGLDRCVPHELLLHRERFAVVSEPGAIGLSDRRRAANPSQRTLLLCRCRGIREPRHARRMCSTGAQGKQRIPGRMVRFRCRSKSDFASMEGVPVILATTPSAMDVPRMGNAKDVRLYT